MKNKSFQIICLLVFIIGLSTSVFAEKINVAASIPPQKYFLQKIGHPYLEITVMVQPGTNPATYEPRPSQLAAISKTRAYFSIGIPFEDVWLDKFKRANPQLTVIHTHRSIKKRAFSNPKSSKDNNHAQARKDPHIWLSPPLVRIMAETILDACISMDQAHAQDYLHNYYQFCNEINKLDSYILKSFNKIGTSSRHFMVYHPAWGYFARTYGLKQVPIEIKGKEPSPKQLLNLISRAKRLGLKTVFVQPQFSKKSARIISRDLNGQVVRLNPLAEDWTNNLKKTAEAISANLR